MSTTIDHLRVDHHVTVIRDFVDTKGKTMRRGDRGIIRHLGFDSRSMELKIEIECPTGPHALTFALRASDGPRNGHMRDYFAVGEEVQMPRPLPPKTLHGSRMIIPHSNPRASRAGGWSESVDDVNSPDKLVAVEEAIQKAHPHLGAAASIAEMYAQRMRIFQHAGDEPRAVAAFKLAVSWMGTYASWATSGGEGMALSMERDRFHADLVREFGYDPSETMQ